MQIFGPTQWSQCFICLFIYLFSMHTQTQTDKWWSMNFDICHDIIIHIREKEGGGKSNHSVSHSVSHVQAKSQQPVDHHKLIMSKLITKINQSIHLNLAIKVHSKYKYNKNFEI